MNRAQLNKLMELVDARIGAAGFVCVEAEWVGTSRTLRLYVDRQDPAEPVMDLEGCVTVNRLLDDAAELDELIDGSYNLEVSSPGLERPLRRIGCFRRFVGSRIKVRLLGEGTGRKRGVGILTGIETAREGEYTLKLETEEGPWSFPLSNLDKASLVHDWDAAMPGGH